MRTVLVLLGCYCLFLYILVRDTLWIRQMNDATKVVIFIVLTAASAYGLTFLVIVFGFGRMHAGG